MRPDYLDCCEQPELERVRTFYQASHDLEALMRCANCQTPWFYRFHEYSTPVGDDLTSWYTRLTDEEAERIRTVEDPPAWTSASSRRVRVGCTTMRAHGRCPGSPAIPWS